MDSGAEGHVDVRVAGDVEPVRLRELLRVAVRRGDEPPCPIQPVDDFPPELDVLRRDSLQ